jgi:hypothetical protein
MSFSFTSASAQFILASSQALADSDFSWVISSVNSPFLAFSLKFSAVRSSSCVFKDVLSVAACVVIPDHLGRSTLQTKKQGCS